MKIQWAASVLSQGSIPDFIQEGGALTLDRFEGDGRVYHSPVYIRDHLITRKTIFDNFMKSTKVHLFIEGPPGCGKTVFTSLLVRMWAKTEQKRVLYIAYSGDSNCPVVEFNGMQVRQVADFPDERGLYAFVKEITNSDEKYDLVLYDGVQQTIRDSKSAIPLCKKEKTFAKAVFVTSLQFRIKDGDNLPDIERIHETDSFDSWTRDQHLKAFLKLSSDGLLGGGLIKNIEDFLVDVSPQEHASPGDALKHKIESYVDFKYFYGGGSARFMVDHTIDRLVEKLKKLTEKVMDEGQWKAFATLAIQTGNSNAVNTLMQRFEDMCTPVSQYIAMVAYDHVGAALVTAIKAVAESTNNPSLLCWAFELDQLEVIKQVLRSPDERAYVSGDNGLAFRPSREIEYDGTQLTGNLGIHDGKVVVVWCTKWNQGCFDVAIYCCGTLATLQFTVSKKHSLKLEYVKQLQDVFIAADMKPNSFAHVGISTSADLKWEAASGIGRSIGSLIFKILRSESLPLKSKSGKYIVTLVPEEGTTVEMRTNKKDADAQQDEGGDAMDVDDHEESEQH